MPALRRMNPSETASIPQRARRSASVWTLPKLVASVTSDAASRNRARLGGSGQLEGHDRPEQAVHLPRGELVRRMGGQARIAHACDVRAPLEQPGDRQGVGRLAP